MVKHILLIVASVVMIYPLLWLIASSFRPNDLIFRTPGLWVSDLYVENYTQGWYALSSPFGTYIINSAIVVIGRLPATCSPARWPRTPSPGCSSG